MQRSLLILTLLVIGEIGIAASFADDAFRTEELATKLKVGYAVRLLDMNGDDKLDICIVDSKRLLWLENPTWKEHVLVEDISKTDNVCFAPYDIDRDGKLDFAVGADWTLNTQKGGTIDWLSAGKTGDWQLRKIGEEPTVHRMRWVNLTGGGEKQLVVAPLLGRGTTRPHFAENGVRLLAYTIPKDPVKDRWPVSVLTDELHVVHNFWPTNFDSDPEDELLVVSFEGVSLLDRQADGSYERTLIGAGDQKSSPNRGASEIKRGQLAGGKDYIATIEPWHGNQVVVYTRNADGKAKSLWTRNVIDAQLKWGHAVWCANLDDDEDEELIIGVRDDLDTRHRRGLRIYDPQSDGQWKQSIVDPGGVAIEDLAAADLNGDGKIDIVAVGRQTHNVKIYWNEQ